MTTVNHPIAEHILYHCVKQKVSEIFQMNCSKENTQFIYSFSPHIVKDLYLFPLNQKTKIKLMKMKGKTEKSKQEKCRQII